MIEMSPWIIRLIIIDVNDIVNCGKCLENITSSLIQKLQYKSRKMINVPKFTRLHIL